jgi:hypothetical protein
MHVLEGLAERILDWPKDARKVQGCLLLGDAFCGKTKFPKEVLLTVGCQLFGAGNFDAETAQGSARGGLPESAQPLWLSLRPDLNLRMPGGFAGSAAGYLRAPLNQTVP